MIIKGFKQILFNTGTDVLFVLKQKIMKKSGFIIAKYETSIAGDIMGMFEVEGSRLSNKKQIEER